MSVTSQCCAQLQVESISCKITDLISEFPCTAEQNHPALLLRREDPHIPEICSLPSSATFFPLSFKFPSLPACLLLSHLLFPIEALALRSSPWADECGHVWPVKKKALKSLHFKHQKPTRICSHWSSIMASITCQKATMHFAEHHLVLLLLLSS